MSTVGLFGITANPPHRGHAHAIEQALAQVDEVYVSLVYRHPFAKDFIAYEHRLKMLQLLLEEYFLPEQLAKIKLIEMDKEYFEKTGNIPYSYDMLKSLKEGSDKTFKLVIGEDNYKPSVWHKFYNYEKIENEFGLVTIPDRGSHSTNVRLMLKDPNQEVARHIGQSALRYIQENQLYR